MSDAVTVQTSPAIVPHLLRLQQAADRSGVSIRTLQRLIKEKRLRATTIPGMTRAVRVWSDELDRFLAADTAT